MDSNEQQQRSHLAGLGLFIWDLIKVFFISMAIILPIRYYVAQPFIVSGSSMEPNFHSGEYLIINEISYRTGQPQRGDIVVFKFPRDNSQYFIKRIIGLPGERVQIADGRVKIFNSQYPSGAALDEVYLPNNNMTFGGSNGATLGSNEYFVLGDNRSASSDSRFWGPVPRSDLIGKVFIRAFPFQNFTKFSRTSY